MRRETSDSRAGQDRIGGPLRQGIQVAMRDASRAEGEATPPGEETGAPLGNAAIHPRQGWCSL